jgi:hypothetical protein
MIHVLLNVAAVYNMQVHPYSLLYFLPGIVGKATGSSQGGLAEASSNLLKSTQPPLTTNCAVQISAHYACLHLQNVRGNYLRGALLAFRRFRFYHFA